MIHPEYRYSPTALGLTASHAVSPPLDAVRDVIAAPVIPGDLTLGGTREDLDPAIALHGHPQIEACRLCSSRRKKRRAETKDEGEFLELFCDDVFQVQLFFLMVLFLVV